MQPTQTVSPELWTYGEHVRTGGDLSGYHVEATDGGVGKVDDATYDDGSSFLVVDTGPWIFGKKVMLPAGIVETVDHDEQSRVRHPDEGRDQERAGVPGRLLRERRLPIRSGAVLRRTRRGCWSDFPQRRHPDGLSQALRVPAVRPPRPAAGGAL